MSYPKNELINLYRAQSAKPASPRTPHWMDGHPDYENSLAAEGRWFTDDLEEAEWYLKQIYPDGDGILVFVEISQELAEQYRLSNISEKPGGKSVAENPRAFSRRPEKEFYLPTALAAHASVLTRRQIPPPASELEPNAIDDLKRANINAQDLIEAIQPTFNTGPIRSDR